MTSVKEHLITLPDEVLQKYDNDSFKFGPFDLYPYQMVVSLIWVYDIAEASETVTDPTTFVPFDLVKKSLAKTLTYYPQLCGRFEFSGSKDATSVKNLDAGMILYEAFHDAPLSNYRVPEHNNEYRMESLPDGGSSLINTWTRLPEDPIFSFQYTKFSCGSVTIGLRTSHRLSDGQGISIFYRNFAEIYRKIRQNNGSADGVELKNVPYIFSYQYNNYDEVSSTTLKANEDILDNQEQLDSKQVFHHQEQQLLAPEEGHNINTTSTTTATATATITTTAASTDTTVAAIYKAGIVPKPNEIKYNEKYARKYLLEAAKDICYQVFYAQQLPYITGRFFYFSQEDLDLLKNHGQGPNRDQWASTYCVLSALIWQSMHKARCDVGEKNNTYIHPTTCFLSCVDISKKAPFPADYYPACNSTPFLDVSTEYLRHCPLWEVAQSIKSIIANTQPNIVKKIVDNKVVENPVILPIIDPNWSCYTSSHVTFWPYDESGLDSECSFVSLPFSRHMLTSGISFFLRPKSGKGITVTLYLENALWESYEKHFFSYRQKK